MNSRRRLGVATRRPLLKFRIKHVVLVGFCLCVCLLLAISASLRKHIEAFPTPQEVTHRLSLRPWLDHLQHRKGRQYELSFRRPNGKWKNPIKSFSSITVDDLRDLELPLLVNPSETDTSQKDFVLDLMAASGVTELDYRVVEALPTWDKFASIYGPNQSPIVVGVENCEKMRKLKEEKELHVGIAGMFNTGTTTLDLYRKSDRMTKKTKVEAPFPDSFSLRQFAKTSTSQTFPVRMALTKGCRGENIDYFLYGRNSCRRNMQRKLTM